MKQYKPSSAKPVAVFVVLSLRAAPRNDMHNAIISPARGSDLFLEKT